jgi:hypothetical protein
MAQLDLGKVAGTDGFNPVIQVVQDDLIAYRLSIQDKTHTVITPNLRGLAAKHFEIEIEGRGSRAIPLPELGLSPDKDYVFYASSGIEYPLLREVVAIRTGNTVQVSVYYDTKPYTEPQLGSPFTGGILQVGEIGLALGMFQIGERLAAESFPVNLLVFEAVSDGRYRIKIGTAGLKIGNFQAGQEIIPPSA